MNEMYNMGIVTHYYGVMAVFGVILLNFYKLKQTKSLKEYRRFNTLFNPIGSTFIGSVLFTGVIMMAAKHLEFTIENILMIIIAIYVIVLEVKRSKKLKYIKNDDIDSFELYKKDITKLLSIEFVVVLLISIWMLI